MCRKIKATTVTRDTSGKPAFTESMIIEERSDLNITDSVIPKSRSSKRTLKASLMENSASPHSHRLCSFRTSCSAANCASASDALSYGVTKLCTVSPGAPLLMTLGEIAARQCPGFRWNVIIENSEMWAIVGIASEGGSRSLPAMSMRGNAGASPLL